jgi:hypothetical protein
MAIFGEVARFGSNLIGVTVERGRKASWPESIAALNQPSQSCLKLYSQLKKAESLAFF